ncbi:low molecular weight protein-tyrosine-phosphatase [Streptomyces sp. NPDC050636]|uniref:low molecular weight protein-tyrosine-phosphatase n=1 Tax=Streptomyces sp. NPDC050636 TaxID=3154510 RepID=UPI00343C8F2B
MKSPFRVCFVCTGNICRSPMAASVFRAHIAEEGLDGLVEVCSAGLGGWFEGDGADPRTVAVLRAGGYDHTHTARQFHPSWFDRLDLVIALDSGHLYELRRLAPTPQDAAKVRLLRSYGAGADGGIGSSVGDDADAAVGLDAGLGPEFRATVGLDVPDPYYGGSAGFEECLEMIEAASDGLLEEVRAAVTAGSPGHDHPGEKESA